MIEVLFYYSRGGGKWTLESKKFRSPDKAIKFIYMTIPHPKMVYHQLICDDPYDAEYIRRKCKL